MDLDFIDYELANTVTMFINTCIFLSYPINFGIYCGMSRWILVLKHLITILVPGSSGRLSAFWSSPH